MHSRAISPHTIFEGENILLQKSTQQHILSFGTCGYVIAEKKIFQQASARNNIRDKKSHNISHLPVNFQIPGKKFNPLFSQAFEKNIKKLIFNGPECTITEINNLSKNIKPNGYVIGIGGGKAIDTAKAVAQKTGVPFISIPTSAATSAATTGLSAIYHKSGIASHYLLFDKCSDLTIIDYNLISTSSPTMLAAGMGDALAKYYESFAFTQGVAHNVYENIALKTAQTIYDMIFSKGKKALHDIKKGIISKEFKDIVRTNIVLAGLVGGIGGEGCRACAAHAVHNGLTHVPEMRHFLHGELVAFGNLVQLMLQKKYTEVKKLQQLYKTLHLPDTFDYFNVKLSKKEFEKAVHHTCSPKDTLKNMPKSVSKNNLRKAFQKLSL